MDRDRVGLRDRKGKPLQEVVCGNYEARPPARDGTFRSHLRNLHITSAARWGEERLRRGLCRALALLSFIDTPGQGEPG